MNPFVIFALVLTSVYVIYYAAVILHDLYSKDKASKKSEEEFDVSNMVIEEEAIDIEEEDTGSQPEYETTVSEDGLQIIGPKDKQQAEEENKEHKALTSAELNEIGNEGTEEIDPKETFACNSQEFLNILNDEYNKKTQRIIKKENVRDNL